MSKLKIDYEQFFDVRPKSKERPRMTRTGHAYTPKATKEYEALIASMYKGPMFDLGLVAVSFVFEKEGTQMIIKPLPKVKVSPLRGDLDNYTKSFLDALNGVAYADDKQVHDLTLRKR